ncbi:MAG: ATP-binding protein [Lachnospiraceae bacterium]|nr:ATP-binding protein [Lachnospiraceae bacterium]
MEFLEIAVYAVIVRTYFYFQETGRENSFDHFPYLKTLSERLTDEAMKIWEKSEGIQAMRYWEVLKKIGNNEDVDPVVHTALDLCLAAALVPEFRAYLSHYTGNPAVIQLAFEMEGNVCPSYEEIMDKLQQLQMICRIDWKTVPLSYAAIEADHRLLAYLLVEDGDKESFKTVIFGNGEWFLCKESLQPMFVRQEAAMECAQWIMTEGTGTVLQIAGEGGRRFLAKHIAHRAGQNLFLLSAEKCISFLAGRTEDVKGELIRELFWKNGMLCLYGLQEGLFTKWQVTEEDFIKEVVWPLLNIGIPILICTEGRFSFYDSRIVGKRMNLNPLTREERQQVFAGFASLYSLSIDCVLYAVRYRLSAREIARAMEIWQQESMGTEQDFTRICTKLLSESSKKSLGNISYPTVRFHDLQVPDEVQKSLEQICCSAMCGYMIFEEWRLKAQYPYGRAVTVMLSGPPGTGKTMTAHAIAGEMGLPLYQVDISKIMDKYIGETEKHLEEIFAFAEKTNIVLFFDEADALFGKRGEVTESKDRYANMEVAYILQRMEQFDGIVILSTNFYNNIDKAFLRRMKYVLKYKMPDKAIRFNLWESCLPEKEFREELDIDYLASQFEFTGGMIKNVILSASVMAVYEENPLSMEHILHAIKAEYEKMEWPISMEMWGEYGYLMM